MLFKGASSSVRGSERIASATEPSLLERDLPPTPTPPSPLPSFSDFQDNYVPPWMRDTASTASTTRQSRASSIVSTLTRFTTTSVDDARSIDIHVGGQNFRIARDASKITSEAPPPYTAADARSISPVLENIRPRMAPIHTPPSETSSEGQIDSPRGPRLNTTLGANILDPTEVDIPSPVGNDDTTPPSTPRTSTRPTRRIDINAANQARSSSSGYGDPDETPGILSRSMTVKPYKYSGPQRTDLPLLSTTPNALEMQGMRPRSSQFKAWQTMSADDLLLSHPEQGLQEPSSPDYMGRNADAMFPLQTTLTVPTRQSRIRSDSGYNGEEDSAKDKESRDTPGMDTENDISKHYARMLRFIDKQHRRVLHARDKEMEKLRERLAEVDTVYRQQLKERDFKIEDLKKRLDHKSDCMEAKLEKARNEVEDVWERRWKDRDFHLRERMSRIESQAGLDLRRSRENLTGHDDDEE
jgi:hypothetical protein